MGATEERKESGAASGSSVPASPSISPGRDSLPPSAPNSVSKASEASPLSAAARDVAAALAAASASISASAPAYASTFAPTLEQPNFSNELVPHSAFPLTPQAGALVAVPEATAEFITVRYVLWYEGGDQRVGRSDMVTIPLKRLKGGSAVKGLEEDVKEAPRERESEREGGSDGAAGKENGAPTGVPAAGGAPIARGLARSPMAGEKGGNPLAGGSGGTPLAGPVPGTCLTQAGLPPRTVEEDEDVQECEDMDPGAVLFLPKAQELDAEGVALAFLSAVHERRAVRDLSHCSAANLKIFWNLSPHEELTDDKFVRILIANPRVLFRVEAPPLPPGSAMGSALRAVRPAGSSLGKRRKSAFKETKATEGANGAAYPNKATPKRPVPWSFAGNAIGPTMRLAASNGIADGAPVPVLGSPLPGPVLTQPSPNTPGFAPPVAPGPLMALAAAQGPLTPAPGVAVALSQSSDAPENSERAIQLYGESIIPESEEEAHERLQLTQDPPNQLPDETVEHYCCRRWLTSRSAVEIEELWFRGRPQLLMPSMAQVESNKEMARRRGYNTPAQRQRRCRQYKVVTAIEAVAEALATTTHEAAQLLDLMITTGDSDDPREFSSLSNLGQSGWPAIVEKVQKGLFRLNLPAEIRPKRRRGNHFS